MPADRSKEPTTQEEQSNRPKRNPSKRNPSKRNPSVSSTSSTSPHPNTTLDFPSMSGQKNSYKKKLRKINNSADPTETTSAPDTMQPHIEPITHTWANQTNDEETFQGEASTMKSSPPTTPGSQSSTLDDEWQDPDPTITLGRHAYSPSVPQDTGNGPDADTPTETPPNQEENANMCIDVNTESPHPLPTTKPAAHPTASVNEEPAREDAPSENPTDKTLRAPTPSPPNDSENEQTTDDQVPLEQQLADLQKEAQKHMGLEIFTFFPSMGKLEIKEKKPNEETAAKILEKVQWAQVPLKNLPPTLSHQSANTLDFMPEGTQEQCKNAVEGKDHTLGLTKMILVDPIHRMLVRLVASNCPLEKQKEWTTHAIRSVLSKAGVPLNGLVAALDMGKPTYDWRVVALTKDAYDAISSIRALFDPRSRSLVLLRPWDIRPQRSQTFIYHGVVTDKDQGETEIELNIALFLDQLNKVLEPYHAKVTKHELIRPESGPKPLTIIISFDLPYPPFHIIPNNLPKSFASANGKRTIKASWVKKCSVCHSENHFRLPGCPWKDQVFEGKSLDMHNAKFLIPGQSESRKRPRETPVLNISEMLSDVRPAKRAKRNQTANMDTDK
jgi:hypothetical protein